MTLIFHNFLFKIIHKNYLDISTDSTLNASPVTDPLIFNSRGASDSHASIHALLVCDPCLINMDMGYYWLWLIEEMSCCLISSWALSKCMDKQRVLMHRHQRWNVRHGLCHIYMRYIYIWVVYSFCLFCCLFIIVTWWYIWCIVWQVASKRKYRHVW